MPRSKAVRKDLSKGWNELYELWKLPLAKKVKNSESLLSQALNTHKRPVVCWSGGKDSGATLHLTLKIDRDIPVIFVETGVDFEETKKFVRKLAKSWKLNLFIAKPKRGDDFWAIGGRYGWPIYGKNIASNVERARRTGNLRPQLSKLERKLVNGGLHISTKCSELLLEKPTKLKEEELGADAKIIGLRAEESRARVRLWVDHGDQYFVKRYFGRGRGIWKVNPIAVWTEKDVLGYHEKHNIPICDLYKMGYPRNGCWPCAMAIRNGQLRRLRKIYPKLFNKLMLETAMGKELMRAKNMAIGKREGKNYSAKDIKKLLEVEPDAFDSL